MSKIRIQINTAVDQPLKSQDSGVINVNASDANSNYIQFGVYRVNTIELTQQTLDLIAYVMANNKDRRIAVVESSNNFRGTVSEIVL